MTQVFDMNKVYLSSEQVQEMTGITQRRVNHILEKNENLMAQCRMAEGGKRRKYGIPISIVDDIVAAETEMRKTIRVPVNKDVEALEQRISDIENFLEDAFFDDWSAFKTSRAPQEV